MIRNGSCVDTQGYLPCFLWGWCKWSAIIVFTNWFLSNLLRQQWQMTWQGGKRWLLPAISCQLLVFMTMDVKQWMHGMPEMLPLLPTVLSWIMAKQGVGIPNFDIEKNETRVNLEMVEWIFTIHGWWASLWIQLMEGLKLSMVVSQILFWAGQTEFTLPPAQSNRAPQLKQISLSLPCELSYSCSVC